MGGSKSKNVNTDAHTASEEPVTSPHPTSDAAATLAPATTEVTHDATAAASAPAPVPAPSSAPASPAAPAAPYLSAVVSHTPAAASSSTAAPRSPPLDLPAKGTRLWWSGTELHLPPMLEVLTLTNQGMGVKETKGMIHALADNKTVRIVNLAGNKLGNSGAELIAGWIKGDELVEVIDLSGNGITDKGVAHIAKAIAANPKLALSQLKLAFNRLTDASCFLLADCVKANSNLVFIDVRGNDGVTANGSWMVECTRSRPALVAVGKADAQLAQQALAAGANAAPSTEPAVVRQRTYSDHSAPVPHQLRLQQAYSACDPPSAAALAAAAPPTDFSAPEPAPAPVAAAPLAPFPSGNVFSSPTAASAPASAASSAALQSTPPLNKKALAKQQALLSHQRRAEIDLDATLEILRAQPAEEVSARLLDEVLVILQTQEKMSRFVQLSVAFRQGSIPCSAFYTYALESLQYDGITRLLPSMIIALHASPIAQQQLRQAHLDYIAVKELLEGSVPAPQTVDEASVAAAEPSADSAPTTPTKVKRAVPDLDSPAASAAPVPAAAVAAVAGAAAVPAVAAPPSVPAAASDSSYQTPAPRRRNSRKEAPAANTDNSLAGAPAAAASPAKPASPAPQPISVPASPAPASATAAAPSSPAPVSPIAASDSSAAAAPASPTAAAGDTSVLHKIMAAKAAAAAAIAEAAAEAAREEAAKEEAAAERKREKKRLKAEAAAAKQAEEDKRRAEEERLQAEQARLAEIAAAEQAAAEAAAAKEAEEKKQAARAARKAEKAEKARLAEIAEAAARAEREERERQQAIEAAAAAREEQRLRELEEDRIAAAERLAEQQAIQKAAEKAARREARAAEKKAAEQARIEAEAEAARAAAEAARVAAAAEEAAAQRRRDKEAERLSKMHRREREAAEAAAAAAQAQAEADAAEAARITLLDETESPTPTRSAPSSAPASAPVSASVLDASDGTADEKEAKRKRKEEKRLKKEKKEARAAEKEREKALADEAAAASAATAKAESAKAAPPPPPPVYASPPIYPSSFSAASSSSSAAGSSAGPLSIPDQVSRWSARYTAQLPLIHIPPVPPPMPEPISSATQASNKFIPYEDEVKLKRLDAAQRARIGALHAAYAQAQSDSAKRDRDQANIKADVVMLLLNLHAIFPPLDAQGKPLGANQPYPFAANLQNDRSASSVKKAYLKATVAVHPDKQVGADANRVQLSSAIFPVLQAAYQHWQNVNKV